MAAVWLVALSWCALVGPTFAGEQAVWSPARYDDVPVRIDLPHGAALESLLGQVPIASFNREQITPAPGGALIFRPRVTEAELAELRAAGYAVTRLPDDEQRGRRAVEAAWARRADKAVVAPPAGPLTDYPTYPEIGAMLANLAATYSSLCDTFIWGTSVQGRALVGIVISDSVGTAEAEPEVRLSSSMHGDETVGMIMLLNLADHLLANHGQPGFEDLTALLDGTEIHIMPLHNPDGYVAGSRFNANGQDLNRNFDEPVQIHPVMEVETAHFRDYGFAHNFVISQNGHTGALVVNYLWDYTDDLAPDDAALQLLSLEYSTHNLPMYNNPRFTEGITNGADWYVANGTLQDWSYDQTGCLDFTMELNNTKWPPAGDLAGLWDDNRESLLAFTAGARYGINGVVTDAVTGLPLDATVTVTGNAKPVVTDPTCGDYYKILPTGTFELTFTATGYTSQTIGGVGTTWGTPTVLNVALQPDTSSVPLLQPLALRAWPNPFNPGTTFTLTAPAAGRASLEIYDARGRLIDRLFDGSVPMGDTPVPWDGRDLDGRAVGAGVYFGRATVGHEVTSVKVVLVR